MICSRYGLPQCAVRRATFEKSPEAASGTEYSSLDSFGCRWGCLYATPLLCELYWMPDCSGSNSRYLNFQVLPGMSPDYLRNCFVPIILACLIQSGRRYMVQTLSMKEFELAGSRKRTLSAIAFTL